VRYLLLDGGSSQTLQKIEASTNPEWIGKSDPEAIKLVACFTPRSTSRVIYLQPDPRTLSRPGGESAPPTTQLGQQLGHLSHPSQPSPASPD
jgi:hypothetical protein